MREGQGRFIATSLAQILSISLTYMHVAGLPEHAELFSASGVAGASRSLGDAQFCKRLRIPGLVLDGVDVQSELVTVYAIDEVAESAADPV